MVGNLTTVSSQVRDFTVLLLGFWFIQRAVEEGTKESDLAMFLKWEQLCGYARGKKGIGGFRGVTTVKKNLSEGTRVTLSADRAHQILGNQKIYGLWGLFTVPARSSGLLTEDPMRLTPRAAELVETAYIPAFTKAGIKNGDAVVRLLRESSVKIDVEGKEAALVDVIGNLLRPNKYSAVERAFYDTMLVQGGPPDLTQGRQARLAALLQKTVEDENYTFSPAALDQLIEAAGDAGQPTSLADPLSSIRHCETVIAPATALFWYLLGRDGKQVDALAESVRKEWGAGLKHLNLAQLAAERSEWERILGNTAPADRWLAIARAMAGGAYVELIQLLVAHNKFVMQQRGGAAPWIEIREGKLHVAFRDEYGELPGRKSLPSLWQSSYFLDSLRSVVGQIRGAA